MKHCSARSRAQDDREPDRLDRLARSLEKAAHMDGWDQPPFAVGIVGARRGDGELHLKDLLAGDPASELIGFSAPPEWEAFGVVASGMAYADDDPTDAWLGDPPDARAIHRDRPLGPVRLAYLLDRSGHEVSILRLADDPVRRVADGSTPLLGRLVDSCHRVLGLSTLAPTTEPRELWALSWLGHVFAEAAEHLDLDWPTIAALHPAAQLLASRDPAMGAYSVDHLVEAGNAFGRAWTWSRLRSACADGTGPINDVPPDHADWMDDGMFARWVLHPYPVVADLLDPLEAALPIDLVLRILDALDAWGLL